MGIFHFELKDCEGRSQVITFQIENGTTQLLTRNTLPMKTRRVFLSIKMLCEISDEKLMLLVKTIGSNCLLPSIEQLKDTRGGLIKEIEQITTIFRIGRELVGIRFTSLESELDDYLTSKKN